MERVGVLLAVLGLGSGLSTWWVNRQGHRAPAAMLGWGLVLAAAGLTALALSTRFAVFAAAAFVAGLGAAPAFTLSETLLQRHTETRTRGRVFSVRDFLMRLVFLVGVSLAGWITRSFGTRPALLACAALVAVAGVLAVSWGPRMAAGAGATTSEGRSPDPRPSAP
jgi:MFS family permease